MLLRDDCAEKIDTESRAHRETTSNLHKSELEMKALETKLYSSSEKVQSCKNEIVMLKSEITSNKNIINELEITLKNSRNDQKDTIIS